MLIKKVGNLLNSFLYREALKMLPAFVKKEKPLLLQNDFING